MVGCVFIHLTAAVEVVGVAFLPCFLGCLSTHRRRRSLAIALNWAGTQAILIESPRRICFRGVIAVEHGCREGLTPLQLAGDGVACAPASIGALLHVPARRLNGEPWRAVGFEACLGALRGLADVMFGRFPRVGSELPDRRVDGFLKIHDVNRNIA